MTLSVVTLRRRRHRHGTPALRLHAGARRPFPIIAADDCLTDMPDAPVPASTPDPTPARPHRVVIVGAGLLGGSLLAALQARRSDAQAPIHLTGVTSAATRDALRERGWCDALFEHADIDDACDAADLVVLCTPLLTIRAQVDRIAAVRHRLARGAIVTDVGSTKGEICAHGAAAFPAAAPDAPQFVGGHPMAGSEQSGLAASDPLLYQSALWVLCPPAGLAEARLALLRSVVQSVGARTATIDPRVHDAAVARISHVPQVLSSVLAGWAGHDADLAATALTLAAGGFRDMTRLALSSVEVWQDIVATNRAPIARGLAELSARLGALAASLQDAGAAAADGALRDAFADGRAFRRRFHMPRKGILRDLTEFVVRLDDRPGQLHALFTPLAAAGVNVQDLEILKVREGESGTILVGFRTPEEAMQARAVIHGAGFAIFDR